MYGQTEATVAQPTTKAAVRESACSLAEAIKDMPEFQALQEAARAINHDEKVQDLLRQMQSHQSAFRLGQGDRANHAAALKKLRSELDGQAAVQAYQQAELAVRTLCRAVDRVVSDAAGVDFAANAKRSCCG